MNYVEKVVISNFKSNSLAFYSVNNKTIYINYKKLIYSISIDCSKILNDQDYYQKILYFNFYVLKILLHEVEHVKQEEKIVINDSDFETKILMESAQRELFLKDMGLYSKEMYYLNPLERQAELKAYKTICEAKGICSNKILKHLINKAYNQLCIMDYHFINGECFSPFDKFGGEMFITEDLLKIIRFDERLNLGLKITVEEYHLIRKLI